MVIVDKTYKFTTLFNEKTGMYIRGDCKDTGKDPFMAEFPHLIDVGIMGHCIHGKTGLCAKAGIGCYQSGMLKEEPNMAVEDFKRIAEECRGRTNQFALGGRGDPDQHEHFAAILKICRENNIVPNFTTSGYGMTPEIAEICKRYCGAVAVSWYRSEYTENAIRMLLNAGVRTNIHYVVGKNTIDEAIEKLQHNSFPEGINAVIFLLHKPVGQGTAGNMLSVNDERLSVFFGEVEKKHPFKVGMDSCFVPGAINFCHDIETASLDTCEGARFSCYIGSDMIMTPCSFDQAGKYTVSLKNMSIEDAWNSQPFNDFRAVMQGACKDCEKRECCLGGCPFVPGNVLCPQRCKPTE